MKSLSIKTRKFADDGWGIWIERALANADLDILSSSVGLRFLCRAEILNKHYSLEKTTEFLKLSMGTTEKAERQAKHLLRTYEKIKEECE